MKRYILILAATMAALSLASRNKDATVPEESSVPADTGSTEFSYTNNYGHTLLAGTLHV